MAKYLKLNDAQTEWASSIYKVKPTQVRRHSDTKLPEFNWFPVVEHTQQLPDGDIYYHAIESWEVLLGKVHIYYTPKLISLDRRAEVLSNRVTQIRDRKLVSGLKFMGFPFDTKESTYKLVLGVTIKAINDPDYTTYWITEDNQRVKMNADHIMAFGSAYERFQNEHFMKARDLKDQIKESNQPHNIDLEGNWPEADYNPDMTPLEVI